MAAHFRDLMAYVAGLFTTLRLILAHALMPSIADILADNERLLLRNKALHRDADDLRRRLGEARPFSRAGLSDHARAILEDERLQPFHEGALLMLALTSSDEVRHSTNVTHPADRWGVPGIFFEDHPAWKRRLDHRTGKLKTQAA